MIYKMEVGLNVAKVVYLACSLKNQFVDLVFKEKSSTAWPFWRKRMKVRLMVLLGKTVVGRLKFGEVIQ